jgi:MFS family permease
LTDLSSLFWTTLSVTEIIGSFLAFGVLHMRGVLGWSGWRWLFLIEGLITLLVGVASFFKMPASAVETKTWFRPKGWFSDREARIVVNRVLRDDPSKGVSRYHPLIWQTGRANMNRRYA